MAILSDEERKELIRLLEAGEPIPERWRSKLFKSGPSSAVIGKEYRLVYEGKLTREEVPAQTPAAPWHLVRTFCTERRLGIPTAPAGIISSPSVVILSEA